MDLAGNAYVTGFTGSADFPVVNPLASNTMLRGFNAFVSKLRFDERGGALTLAYSTYLGGSGNSFGQGDFGNAIAVDRAGNAYVTGGTGSADFPQVNPLASSKPPSGGNSTAFVSKLSFNPATHALSLAYSTYLGGSGQDQGLGIAVDWLGNAYVTGFTGSADFPTAHPLASGAALRGGTNVFVVKLGGQ